VRNPRGNDGGRACAINHDDAARRRFPPLKLGVVDNSKPDRFTHEITRGTSLNGTSSSPWKRGRSTARWVWITVVAPYACNPLTELGNGALSDAQD